MTSAIAFVLVLLAFVPARVSANPDFGWGSPLILSTDLSYNAYNPSVAMGADGTGIVVWEANTIRSSRFVPGTGWSDAVIIDSFGGSTRARVAMDSSGDAIAVWQSANNIVANRFTPSTGWGSAELIESSAGPAYQPEIAMDRGGNATVVWYQWNGTSYNATANRYVVGAGWSGETFLAGFSASISRVRTAMGPGGLAIAVWRQYDGISYSVYADRFVPGTGWTGPVVLNSTTQSADFPWAAMDFSGNAIVVWSQFDGVVQSSFAARYTLGLGWSPAVGIGNSTGNAYEQRVAMNAAGYAIAAWTQSDPGDYNIVVNRYVPGTGWTGPVVVDTRVDSAYAPFVAIDNDGNAIVVWLQYDGWTDSVLANRYVSGLGWTGVALLERSPGAAEFPRVAVDARGNAIAAWDQYDDLEGVNSIFVNRFVRDNVAPTLVVSSPTEALLGTSSVTVAGTTEPGAKVTINGTPVAVDGTGAFSRSVTLADGSYSFTIVARDSEGNTNTKTIVVTVDTTAPTLTLASPAAGANVEVPTVGVAGTTEPGARLVVNGIVVDVSPSGAFSLQLALKEGSNSIVATASDQLGRSTSVTRTVTYTNPVPSLEQQLKDARDELNSTRENLTSTKTALDTANVNLSGLSALTYVLMALLVVFVVVSVVEFVMYQRLSRKLMKPPGPPGGGADEP